MALQEARFAPKWRKFASRKGLGANRNAFNRKGLGVRVYILRAD